MGQQIRGVGAMRRRVIRSVRAASACGLVAAFAGFLIDAPALAQKYAPDTSNRVIVDYGVLDALGSGGGMPAQPAYPMAAPAYAPPAYAPPAHPGYNHYHAMQQAH